MSVRCGGVGSRVLGGDRGASSVEAAIILPALLLLFFAVVHGAAFLHAGNIAQASAQAAYEEARLFDGTAAQGVAAGQAAGAASGGGLENVTVTVDRGTETVTVTVTGRAPMLIPGLPLDVTRTVTGPVERWSQ